MPSFSWSLESSSTPAPAVASAATAGQPGRDLALDTDGDLLVEDGDLQLVAGLASVEQDAACRLRFIRGEWFLDPTIGVDWHGEIFVKSPNIPRIRDLFVTELKATPGIVDVPEFTLDFDAATRSLTGTFRALAELGEINGSIGATP